jgi:hypothetical protein
VKPCLKKPKSNKQINKQKRVIESGQNEALEIEFSPVTEKKKKSPATNDLTCLLLYKNFLTG